MSVPTENSGSPGESSSASLNTSKIVAKSSAKNSKFDWLFRPASIWVGIIAVGPLALPLLWKSDSYSKKAKVLISILVIIVFVATTILFSKGVLELIKGLMVIQKM